MKAAGTISRPSRRRGASSVEYIMVLAFVVIPIAMCTPLLMKMITVYASRITWVLRLPFG